MASSSNLTVPEARRAISGLMWPARLAGVFEPVSITVLARDEVSARPISDQLSRTLRNPSGCGLVDLGLMAAIAGNDDPAFLVPLAEELQAEALDRWAHLVVSVTPGTSGSIEWLGPACAAAGRDLVLVVVRDPDGDDEPVASQAAEWCGDRQFAGVTVVNFDGTVQLPLVNASEVDLDTVWPGVDGTELDMERDSSHPEPNEAVGSKEAGPDVLVSEQPAMPASPDPEKPTVQNFESGGRRISITVPPRRKKTRTTPTEAASPKAPAKLNAKPAPMEKEKSAGRAKAPASKPASRSPVKPIASTPPTPPASPPSEPVDDDVVARRRAQIARIRGSRKASE